MATPTGLLGINPSSSHLFGLPTASIALVLRERISSHHAGATYKKRPRQSGLLLNGDPGRIRTCGPQLRRLLLYPTELRGHRLDIIRISFEMSSSFLVNRPSDSTNRHVLVFLLPQQGQVSALLPLVLAHGLHEQPEELPFALYWSFLFCFGGYVCPDNGLF